MQRQFLYSFCSFLCTHENICHGVPSKTIPRDKQPPMLAYRGKGLVLSSVVFWIYFYLSGSLTC